MGNNSYHRSFIILNALDSGYSLDSRKEPAGYCKIEIKKNQGRMQVYVQDMRPAESHQGIYDIVLVSGSQSVGAIKLTSIQVPDSGKGEYEVTFDPSNVQESGHSIGDFHGLAVVYRSLEGRQTLHYPLVGYSDKRIQLDWKGAVAEKLSRLYHIKAVNSNEYLAVQYKDTKADDVYNAVEGYVEAEDEASVETVRSPEDDSVLSAPDFVGSEAEHAGDEFVEAAEAEHGHPEYYAEAVESEKIEFDVSAEGVDFSGQEQYVLVDDETFYNKLEGAYNQPVKEHDPGIDTPYSMNYGAATYWDKVKDYFTGLFDGHKKVCPFDEVVGEVDWIRIDHRNEPLNSYYYRPVDVYTNSAHLDHYLVGLERQQGKVRYVIYGIPGVYSALPPMSMHGFSRWLPVKNAYGAGYWMLYIDALTGNISYPY